MAIVRGAKIIVLDKSNHALVLRRSGTHPHVPLTSDLPGGKVEAHESPAGGCLRELEEETGIVINEAQLVLLGERELTSYGRDLRVYLFGVRLKDERPDVRLSWEHDKYDWVKVDTVNDLDEIFQPMVEEARRGQGWASL